MLISRAEVAYSAAVAAEDWSARPRLPTWNGYLRAQVVDARGNLLALSNPLY